jgi:hypothetical protein
MNNISWSAALLPPQEMVPPESTPHTSLLTANQLFGFFPAPDWETIALPEQVQKTGSSEAMDDAIVSPATVEFVAFV